MPLISFLLSTVLLFFYAVVGHDAWQWFLQPLGAPAITYWHMMGIILMVKFLSSPTTLADMAILSEADAGDLSSMGLLRTCLRFVYTLIMWGIMALVHGQMT